MNSSLVVTCTHAKGFPAAPRLSRDAPWAPMEAAAHPNVGIVFCRPERRVREVLKPPKSCPRSPDHVIPISSPPARPPRHEVLDEYAAALHSDLAQKEQGILVNLLLRENASPPPPPPAAPRRSFADCVDALDGFGSVCSPGDLEAHPPEAAVHAACVSTAEGKIAELRRVAGAWLLTDEGGDAA